METVTIELSPLGERLTVPRGAALQDLLFTRGVEFPCGGRGRCKGCKVRVLSGSLAVTDEDRHKLSTAELDAGWRLSCRARAEGDMRLELAQWEAAILADDTQFEFVPQEGVGIAVDLGTTTLVAQLVDFETGNVLAVQSALNEQARHGADLMSRIEHAVAESGHQELERLIRKQIGGMAAQLVQSGHAGNRPVKTVVLVGNTVMHHLFCGLDLAPMSQYPFEPAHPGLQNFRASRLGWDLGGDPEVCFLPCLGGFVGSDILAGILAIRLYEQEALVALVDLGTNGELVVGDRRGMVCASTAAGPAFEGARIAMGMRAATGAIAEVHLESGQIRCHTLGGVEPRGICGSGLVDAVAVGLDLGHIRSNGRLTCGDKLMLADPVWLNQWDIRELQLAKGAIAAGLRILTSEFQANIDELREVYLAGAFGNYINQASARRIGLLSFPAEKVVPSGNTALLGAKLALFDAGRRDLGYPDLLRQVRHLSLKEHAEFQEAYVEAMSFPSATEA